MLKNKYWYEDEYMYFSFAGVHSSKYNLFIENNKDLTIENTIGAQSTFSNAYKQEGTYYLGTSRTQKTFKRKCASRGLTINEYKDMLLWLTPGNSGTLIFDNDKYWGWDVIVDTVGDAKYWNDYGDLVVEFDITFKTIGTYLAHSIYPCIWETINDSVSQNDILQSVANSNRYGIPPVVVSQNPDNNNITFVIQDVANNSNNFIYNLFYNFNEGSYLNASITGVLKQIFYVPKPNQSVVPPYFDEVNIVYDNYKFIFNGDYSTQTVKIFNYNSKTGLLSINGQLAEENEDCNYHKEVNGLLKINTSSPVLITTGELTSIEELPTTDSQIIGLTPELKNKLIQYNPEQQLYYCKYDYLCLVVTKQNAIQNATQYSNALYNNNTYQNCYISAINFNPMTIAFSTCFELLTYDDPDPSILVINGLPNDMAVGDKFVLYGGYSNKFELDSQIENSNDISLDDFNISVTSLNNM